MLGIMSLPTAQDSNAAQMLAGMQLLQAPEFLQQIAARMPVLRDNDDQDSLDELLLNQQEMYDASLKKLLGEETTLPTTFNYDTRRPDMLGISMEELPTVYEKYIEPFLPFNSGPVPGSRFMRRQGLSSGGLAEIEDKIKDMYRNFGLASLIEEAYSFGVNQLPLIYDTLGVSGFFNKGGSVSTKIDDNYKSLQLADEDTYLKGEMLGDEDPLYNYTLGLNLSDIMPGLSAEFGIRDDAIMEPGMMSPDDEKFFKLLYNF